MVKSQNFETNLDWCVGFHGGLNSKSTDSDSDWKQEEEDEEEEEERENDHDGDDYSTIIYYYVLLLLLLVLLLITMTTYLWIINDSQLLLSLFWSLSRSHKIIMMIVEGFDLLKTLRGW